MFSWLTGGHKRKEVESYNNVIDGLKKIYKKKLYPLEKASLFGEFHSPYLNDGDFEAKPMVLLIGQYSTGKTTFLRYLLEKDFPGMRIGPEPTTDRFVAIMHGPNEQVTPGNALAVDPNRQFRALQHYGNAFLSKFEGSFLPSPVLESITLIDTPGILSGEKQRLHRGYDFEGVIGWFADRADMIILLFDAHKLDISDEFRRVIDIIKKNHDKIKVVLNKSDMVNTQQLMRVYGALMWSLGKVLATPEVNRVFIGSFWDKPFQFDELRKLFEAEHEDLFACIQSLTRTAAVRKLNELIKRARLAKVQAFILDHLRNEMPAIFKKESKKQDLIQNLDQVFNHLHKSRQIPVGDFPRVRDMREKLGEYDFKAFPRLNVPLINAVDDMLAQDISRLMKMLPKEEDMTKDRRIKGGAFGYTDHDPFSQKQDLTKDATYRGYDEGWIVAQDTAKYDVIFDKLGPNHQGKISGGTAREELMKSKLPNSVLRRIWALSDIDNDGHLDRDEFALAMFLLDHKLSGNDLPDVLPEKLVPPSKRMLFKSHHYGGGGARGGGGGGGGDLGGVSSSGYSSGGGPPVDSYRGDSYNPDSYRGDSYRSSPRMGDQYGGGRDQYGGGRGEYSISRGRRMDDYDADSAGDGGLDSFVDGRR